MSKSKYTTAICLVITALMLVTTCLFYAGESLGITVARADMPYAASLFSNDKVHTIDIVVNDGSWSNMLANVRAEEYIPVTVVIDGRKVSNVGIRPKGNSSLSTIAMSDSDRCSFKVEFDHYVTGRTYLGLDKLALNNVAQDNTYMKDFVSYKLMAAAGADAPLCSFIYITVNGEDWGLYLAVEGIEESFANRVYGANYGQIYKPDSMDMNQGMQGQDGGGQDRVQRPEFTGTFEFPDDMDFENFGSFEDFENFGNFGGAGQRTPPEGMPEGFPGGAMPQGEGTMPGAAQQPGGEENPQQDRAQFGGGWEGLGGFGGFGRGGGSATSLVYTDDDPASYSAIFDNAAFNAASADESRLIASLKNLNERIDLEKTVDITKVLNYFAAHNFTVNSDSYTGNMVHNYYLYEKDGQLSMIPWDYNLAFGGMGGMGGGILSRNAQGDPAAQGNAGTVTTAVVDTATSSVNTPIDSLLSGSSGSRPMWDWIESDETYIEMYHAAYLNLIESFFDSGEFGTLYDHTIALISPYVENDPTSFCTYDEFLAGQAALKEYCLLRAQSVLAQIHGAIASTTEAQTASGYEGFVSAAAVDITAMGSNSRGFVNARGGFRMPTRGEPDSAYGVSNNSGGDS
ncbi:MAG: CotH kinase family protein [Oscillospiraceae bacterium]|jgi:spore coat protein CotH|nr:CotH kinase family protein [Oscillospiraceae bacterium]